MKSKKPENRDNVIVYTPESQLRHPGQLFNSMYRDLLASRELAWRLMIRDINARYRQSILGFLWAFLPPLATAATFILLNSNGVINTGEIDIPYPVFVMIGTVLWQVFVESIAAPLNTVINNKSMLVKINFPREAILLSSLGTLFFDLAIKIIILAGVFIFYRIPVTSSIFPAFLAVIALMLLGFTIGMVLTPIGVLYGDVSKALPIITSLWMFVTPVVYTIPQGGLLGHIAYYNPVTPILAGTRELIVSGYITDINSFLTIVGITFFVLLVMWVIYRISLPLLIERVSA